jgi:hypothetical protein
MKIFQKWIFSSYILIIILQHGHNRQILKEIHIGETYFKVGEINLKLMEQSWFCGNKGLERPCFGQINLQKTK